VDEEVLNQIVKLDGKIEALLMAFKDHIVVTNAALRGHADTMGDLMEQRIKEFPSEFRKSSLVLTLQAIRQECRRVGNIDVPDSDDASG
jgi:hypothetical protein